VQAATTTAPDLFSVALRCLEVSDPSEKVRLTGFFARQYRDGLLRVDQTIPVKSLPVPGRPEQPELVSPAKLVRRSINTPKGLQALIHAICHIEFNAINLALDAIYRFRDMPDQYYADWWQVAEEEAYHFSLLREHLVQLGSDYGCYPAHNGLWEMACKTDHDVLVRMALVPRVLEARGLDVTPGMIKKLQAAGDLRSVNILEIILRDEIGHVAIGSRWFQALCEQRDLDPEPTFASLVIEYMKGSLKGPFYEEGRLQAGFSIQELNSLKQQAGKNE
jgi:uncharacterized ferritin-like protein (DUF455 family)